MNLDELLQAVYSYMNIKKETGDLSNVPKDKIHHPNSLSSYTTPVCTLEAKEKFDGAKQKLETVLNNYIDDRVKAVIESMKIDA